MEHDPKRRAALMGLSVAAGAAMLDARPAGAVKATDAWLPEGAATLKGLHARLAASERRRDFKTVPMVLTEEAYWDNEALKELIAYRGSPKQLWDNKDIGGPWLNLMRNNLNVHQNSFKHPDFLIVSATHASAHLTMYDQSIWDKYQLTKLTNGAIANNRFIVEQPAAAKDPKNLQDPEGAYSPRNNSIPALQRRGVVFFACHNSIWENTDALIRSGVNPDKLSHEQLAAELTNHIIPDAVLTPGAVATALELQQVGYQYAT